MICDVKCLEMRKKNYLVKKISKGMAGAYSEGIRFVFYSDQLQYLPDSCSNKLDFFDELLQLDPTKIIYRRTKKRLII